MAVQRRESVTTADVARAAMVSKATAARVLSGRGSASEEARERVLRAAETLGYVPNELAKAMSIGVTNTIGVVIPDIANPFFASVVRGISDRLRSKGIEIIISNTDNDPQVEARALRLLAAKRVDGLVLAPVIPGPSKVAADLSDKGLPMVLLDRRTEGLEAIPLVSLDHAATARLATRHLLTLGHERIAILTEVPELALHQPNPSGGIHRPAALRLWGHVSALRDAGIDLDPGLVLGADYDQQSAAQAVRSGLPRTGATALFCTDSVLTSGAYRGIAALGIRLPDQLSFIGFDDQDWTTMVTPAVTVMAQPPKKLGDAAADVLLRRVEEPEVPVEDTIFQGELLVRGSTRPLGAKSPRAGVRGASQPTELVEESS